MAEPRQRPVGGASVVGSCDATDCRHNEDHECRAGEITVRMAGRGAECGTYDPEKPKARP
jgi:hypothetical protein